MTDPPDARGPARRGGDDLIAGREPGTPVLRRQGAAVAAVALGGAVGALARYAVGVAFPAAPGAFPLGTLGINVLGCLLMGVLVVVVTETRDAHPIVRPLVGVGVLGGFTTFSTFAVDTEALLGAGPGGPGAVATGLGYLAATVVGSVGAAAVGLAVTRRVAGDRRAG